jgi:hypothetical protein
MQHFLHFCSVLPPSECGSSRHPSHPRVLFRDMRSKSHKPFPMCPVTNLGPN